MPIKVRSIFITPLFYAPSFELISSAAKLSDSALEFVYDYLVLYSTLNGEGKRKVGTRRKKGVSVANRLKAKVASEI